MLYGAIAASKIMPPTQAEAIFYGAGNLTILVRSLLQASATFAGTGSLSLSAAITNPILQGSALFAGAGQMIAELSPPDDSATTAWVAAVVSAGGTVSDERKSLVNNLVLGLKSDGLWTKLDRLWLFAAENSQSALIDLVAASSASLVATNPTFTADRGFTGNASGYINTGFNATSGTPKFTQNDSHWSLWNLKGDAISGNTGIHGNGGAGGAQWSYYNGGHYRLINDNGIGGAYDAPSSLIGHHLVSRPSSTNSYHYRNGSLYQNPAATSSAVLNANFYVLWDSTANAKSVMEVAAYSIGSNLNGGSDASNFYNRLQTYMTAVGL